MIRGAYGISIICLSCIPLPDGSSAVIGDAVGSEASGGSEASNGSEDDSPGSTAGCSSADECATALVARWRECLEKHCGSCEQEEADAIRAVRQANGAVAATQLTQSDGAVAPATKEGACDVNDDGTDDDGTDDDGTDDDGTDDDGTDDDGTDDDHDWSSDHGGNDNASGGLSGCSFNGKPLYGKIQEVSSFPDVKVQVVGSFPDLKVQLVSSFPNSCGKWQMVTSFPDTKVQFVNSFPDVKIQYVTSFPGLR